MSDSHHEHDHDGEHVCFFGDHRLHAPHEHMKARDLKEFIAKHVEGFNRDHTLVLEESGDRPDKPLNDDDQVHIHEFPHFYDQPPANFGR